jgi:hypothetical protein
MNGSDRTTGWLTLAVAVTAPLVIGSSGAISYSSLYELARVVGGYGELEAHLFPFPIDFTLGGAVAASFLLARWRAPFWPRFWIALQVGLSAIVTISGNALHGSIVGDPHAWPWGLRLMVSAVPGAAIVGMTHAVTIMLRHRPGDAVRDRDMRSANERAPQRVRSRSSLAPKEARVRALLTEGRIAFLAGEDRASLIARVAGQVAGSRSYVRKIAGRIEREARRDASGDTALVTAEPAGSTGEVS